MLMPRTSHQGAGMTVQQYLEGNSRCSHKWVTPTDPNWYWSNGDCFGRGPVSAQSTFDFANVPWDYTTHQPTIDMRNRVLIKNSSVCIDDRDYGFPNPLKTSSTWSGLCLP